MKKLEGARAQMELWQKPAGVIPANSLWDFALQTMFDLLIRIANRQLPGITSMYALRAVDLKDMVAVDLWNAGEQRPVDTLIRWRVILGQPVAGPGTVITEQRALKAGIPVFRLKTPDEEVLRTLAMIPENSCKGHLLWLKKLTDHILTLKELLTFRVPIQ